MIAILPLCNCGIPDFIPDNNIADFFFRIEEEIQNIPRIHEVRLFTDKGMLSNQRCSSGRKIHDIRFDSPFKGVTPKHLYHNPVLLEGIPDDEVVLVINPRNPFLTRKIFQDALGSFERIGKGILVSVVPSIDNPCQLFSIDPGEKGDIFFSESICPASHSLFPEDRYLWTRPDKNTPAINTITGKEILGRQDFPEIYELDGSFLLSQVSSFKKQSEKSLFGYILKQDSSICISDNLDYLKYKACLRAIENAG